MKVLFTTLLTLLSYGNFAQYLNAVDVSEINLCLKNNPNRTITLGSTIDVAIATLGKPIKRYDQFNEMDVVMTDVLEYNDQNKLYFENGKLRGFEINNFEESPITICKENHAVLAAQDIVDIYANIPSHASALIDLRSPHHYRRYKHAILKKDNIASDSYLYVAYDVLQNSDWLTNTNDGGVLLMPVVGSIRGIIVGDQ